MTTTHDTAATYFIATYSNGTPDSTHATEAEAVEEVVETMGWGEAYASDYYDTDRGSAVSLYESAAECDADDEGAYAPRIVEVTS